MTNWKTCLQFQIACSQFRNQAISRIGKWWLASRDAPMGRTVGHVDDSRAIGALLLTRPPTPLVRHAATSSMNLASAVLGLSPVLP